MKRILTIVCLALACFCARATDIITATIAVTNTAGTTNGQTLTVNSDLRTWTNSVFVPGSQVLTNSAIGGAATNLFNEVALYPFSGLSLAHNGTNGITLQTAPGGALSVALSAGWGTVVLTTNSLTDATVVRVPPSVEIAQQQTNVSSGVTSWLRNPGNTNLLYESDPVMANFMGLTNSQTIAGIKKITNAASLYQGIVSNSPAISGKVAGAGGWGLTNGVYWTPTNVNPVLSNAVNYGNPMSSPGSGFLSEQFGAGAAATGGGALAFGNNSSATDNATAVGGAAVASGQASTAVGHNAVAVNNSDSAFGANATAAGTNSTALGNGATVSAGHTNSTAIGTGAGTTAANQIMLGGSGINAVIQNSLSVGGGATFTAGVTNLIVRGTNSFPTGSDIAFGRFVSSGLANGNNAGVLVGTNVYVAVSGPSGAFTINGIAGGRDGKLVTIENSTGQTMTIANQSGVDPTAANRILTGASADISLTNNPGFVDLIYDGTASRWKVKSRTN